MRHQSAFGRAGFMLGFSLAFAAAHAQESAVLGPVERVNLGESSVTVLGQTYDLTPSMVFTMGAKTYSLSEALRIVRPGIYVSVLGTDLPNGRTRAQEIQVSRRSYVPGASDVFISGFVSSYDALTGHAMVGELRIDVTATFASNTSLEIGVGSQIEAFGRQATSGGVVWATELRVAQSAGIERTSTAGAGTQSISGTGISAQSISGTGTQSISGTGTSAQSISGTGMQSISGTGISAQSISGTGTQSISGTGMQSISGTGISAQSISGTGTQSISGTGVRTLLK